MAAIAVGGTVALGGGGTAAFEGMSMPKFRSTQAAKNPRGVELRAVARWQGRGYKVKIQERSELGSCRDHSYGRVTRFFADHPCRSLHRFLAELRTPRGNTVVVAVSTVDMPDVGSATEFSLVDRHGTGNIVELPKEYRKYRNVEFTGHRYRSWRDENLVTNIQAEPVGRTPGAFVLGEIIRLGTS
ncbi:hypothetical protein AB0H34_27340 [Saccharopolyspora shandongensis]|uniref:hypothetical protein n=1 Tax=Saccharopolyspora shandongensis TaxID=418495 RepID=UPI0033F09A31